jgi:hypothetical protein
MVMVKTTLYLPESMKRAIERLAQQRDVTEAQFIRESLEAAVGSSRPRPRGGLIAATSGDIDWNTNEHLAGFGER